MDAWAVVFQELKSGTWAVVLQELKSGRNSEKLANALSSSIVIVVSTRIAPFTVLVARAEYFILLTSCSKKGECSSTKSQGT